MAAGVDPKEELHFDENTIKKVYEALLAIGIFGQKAVDAVNKIEEFGVVFREKKPKRRGRPPKITEVIAETPEPEPTPLGTKEDPWAPNPAEQDGFNGNA